LRCATRRFAVPLIQPRKIMKPVQVAALALALIGSASVAAEQWAASASPEAYVRNIRVFANTPAAGQTTLYAATLGAGVVKVVDTGTNVSVTQLNNGLPLHRIRSVQGTDVNNLYLGIESWGVYKTTDGGANWSAANGSGGGALGCRIVRNLTVRTVSEIWAATACARNSGVYRTTDAGVTWARVGSPTIPDDAPIISLTFSGTGPTTVVLAATGRYGLFRSADNGTTWAQINNGLPAPAGPNRLSVFNAVVLASATQMMAYVEGQGVYRTTDSGANWTPSGTGYPSNGNSLGGITRESATLFYLGTDKGPVYRSTDAGLNWSVWGTTGGGEDTSYARGVTADGVPNRFWLHGINGLFKTTDNGATFTAIPFPKGYLNNGQFAANGTTVYIGTFTNVYKQLDVYQPWVDALEVGNPLPSSIGNVIVDAANAGTLYATMPSSGVYKTTNDGAVWAPLIIPNRETGANPVIEIALSNPQVLYAGLDNKYGTATGGGVMKSTNGGNTWADSSTGLGTPDARQVNSIALTTDPNNLVITTDDGVYRSTNAGASWTRTLSVTDGTGAFLPFGSARHDVVNPSIVWVTAHHTDPDGTLRSSSGVYKSVDGGATWNQALSGKRASAVRPEGNGRVVVLLERDLSQPMLLASRDGGATWQNFNNGIAENDGTGLARTSNGPGAHLVLAFSASNTYVLQKQDLALNVTGSGSVTSNPSGLSCPGSCTAKFYDGDTVTLSATPASGSLFSGWSGVCTGTGTCNVTMDAAKSVTAAFTLANPPRLVNISTRMQVLTGNNVMIAGFIIGGSAAKTVVVRARGPSLAPAGIANPLMNPALTLVRSVDNAIIGSNDDWQLAANAAQITSSGFAPDDSREAAILMTLGPGAYTAIVSGVGNTTGVGLVEVFEVDAITIPLINISTRGQVLTGNDVMIGGFIIQGSGPQTVVVRARGPSLAPAGIANPLANPMLTLVRSIDNAIIGSNDNWQAAANAAQISSSGFAPDDPAESAILITLQPGAYTAIVQGVSNGTGVAIVEVFTTP
jgi:hypothetical protein